MFFFHHQTKGGSELWAGALSDLRAEIEKTSAFTTTMDYDNAFTDDLNAEERAKVKYRPTKGMYFDFDSDDLDEVLGHVRIFAEKLKQEYEFDLNSARWYFSGGKGVHCEIPFSCFVPKVSATGYVNLPQTFKEVAFTLFVDGMDMRVYSSRRMWRTPNILRENGRYKVQVTPHEVMTADLEAYKTICSAPRALFEPPVIGMNSKLAFLFASKYDEVGKKVKHRVAHPPKPPHFTEYPDSLRLLLAGVGVRPDAGWNQIAIQLASLALAMKKSEEAFIKDAKGLIESHVSEGRYDTPRKRERELRSQYRYQDNNPSYSYSIGGLLSIFENPRAAQDMRGGDAGADDPDDEIEESLPPPAAKEESDTPPASTSEAPADGVDDQLSRSIRWNKNGMYQLKEEEWRRVSHLGISDVRALHSTNTDSDGNSDVLGFEAKIYADAKFLGTHFIPVATFASKAALNGFGLKWACSINIPDAAASLVADYMRVRTTRSGNVLYVVSREGVDLIQEPRKEPKDKKDKKAEDKPSEDVGLLEAALNPAPVESDDSAEPADPINLLDVNARPYHFIWASADGVLADEQLRGGGHKFHFNGLHEKRGVFKSDLLDAPELIDGGGMVEFIDALFKINDEKTLAKMIGWFSACFMCQPIRTVWKQFPILQVYGEAGSGKSKTVELFNHMHYWQNDPKKLSASGQTFFPILAAVSQSASFPVVFEEFKPREMTKYARDTILNIVRNNYDGSRLERGGLSKDPGNKEIVINGFTNTAPIAFMGEAMETQTAAVERCVIVPMSKAARLGRDSHWEKVHTERRRMGIIGKALAKAVLTQVNFKQLGDSLEKYRAMYKEQLTAEAYSLQSRPIHNLCVALLGLDLFDTVLKSVFGDKYKKQMGALRESMFDDAQTNVPKAVSEIVKTLDVIARMTRYHDPSIRLDPMMDYCVDGDIVAIKVKQVYAKYSMYCKQTNTECFYDSDSAFIKALESYPGMKTQVADAKRIRRNPWEVIFGLSASRMGEDEIEPFGGD